MRVKISAWNIQKSETNIYEHITPQTSRRPPGICLQNDPKKFLDPVWKEALSVFLAMHPTSVLVLTNKSRMASFRWLQMEKVMVTNGKVRNVGCRVHDVPDRPVSLLARLCRRSFLHVTGPRNLRETERLDLNITGSVTLQFEFLNILFSPFLVTWESSSIVIALMFQPDLSLSWQEARLTPLARD